MRCRRSPHSAASLSSESARWAPRLFGATAWISSTMTDRAVASIARPDSRAKQNVERFRRRHQDVRRAAAHPLALGGGRVARSDPGADFDIGKPAPAELLSDAGQRRLEVAMDVVRQRLERRDVDDLRRIGERRLETLPHQVVDRRQKGRERLARSGRRGDEGVAAGLDRRPGFGLRGRRRGEALGEPVRDRRVEQGFDGGRRSRRGRALRPRRFARPRSKLSRSATSGLAPQWTPPDKACERLYMAPDRALVTLAPTPAANRCLGQALDRGLRPMLAEALSGSGDQCAAADQQ